MRRDEKDGEDALFEIDVSAAPRIAFDILISDGTPLRRLVGSVFPNL